MADTTISQLSRQTSTTTGLIVPISDGTSTIGVPVSAIILASGDKGTGSFVLPKGGDIQGGVEGAIRYNTTIKKLEFYNGTRWSGATTTYTIEYLVIAGGGGGGSAWVNTTANSSAGGGGGYRSSISGENSGGGNTSEPQAALTVDSVYSISVGGGGAGAPNNTSTIGQNGSTSSIIGTNVNIVSLGGGFGAGGDTTGNDAYGGNGGSGGGAGFSSNNNCNSGLPNAGEGTINQGYKGACRPVGVSIGCAGGGAGGIGTSSSIGNLRIGGSGVLSNVTGSAVRRAGGGGPGGASGLPPGVGSDGGGSGAAYRSVGVPNNSGTVNTGGGGGGGGAGDTSASYNGQGGSGGSGLVVLKIPLANYSGVYSGNPTVQDFPSVNPTHKVLIYTGGGTYTA